MPFRVVLALHIAPNFNAFAKHGGLPPRVDHDKVNFQALQAAFASCFHYGPPVDLSLPNDTIDQVTLHSRWGELPGTRKQPESLLRFHDFGAAWLAIKPKPTGPVHDVRAAWSRLHAKQISDRKWAPPPSIVPFMVTAHDFEDTAIWVASAQATLGQVNSDVTPQEGSLPSPLGAALQSAFGIAFDSQGAFISRIGWDKPPAAYAAIPL